MTEKNRPNPFRAHPWHGVSPGEHWPEIVTAYIIYATLYGREEALQVIRLSRDDYLAQFA